MFKRNPEVCSSCRKAMDFVSLYIGEMRGRKMNGSVQKAIEEITNRTPNFPEKQFLIISENPDLAIPYLNAAIDRAVSEGEDLDENYQLHFYAIFLLGQFQERESFPRIMKLVSLPRDVLDGMIGDAVTSGLQDILYNTYNGDKELLKTSIKNKNMDDYARSAMLKVVGQLHLDGEFGKEELQELIREIVYNEEEIGDYIYTELIYTMCGCHFVEMLPEIRRLFEDGRIDGFAFEGYAECVDMMFRYNKEAFCRSPIHAADMLRSWSMFEQPEQNELSQKEMEKLLRKAAAQYNKPEKKVKIGRNDPCPCGSGKKYKKCCMNKPQSPVDLVESEQEKKKWLEYYPASAEERQEGRVYLEDFYDRESIEIDKLIYLALKHRAIPIWQREADEAVEHRKKVYLSEAFSKFLEKTEKEGIKTFQEYDEKYIIHYPCEEWLQVLQNLSKNDDKELFDSVTACCKKMQGS